MIYIFSPYKNNSYQHKILLEASNYLQQAAPSNNKLGSSVETRKAKRLVLFNRIELYMILGITNRLRLPSFINKVLAYTAEKYTSSRANNREIKALTDSYSISNSSPIKPLTYLMIILFFHYYDSKIKYFLQKNKESANQSVYILFNGRFIPETILLNNLHKNGLAYIAAERGFTIRTFALYSNFLPGDLSQRYKMYSESERYLSEGSKYQAQTILKKRLRGKNTNWKTHFLSKSYLPNQNVKKKPYILYLTSSNYELDSNPTWRAKDQAILFEWICIATERIKKNQNISMSVVYRGHPNPKNKVDDEVLRAKCASLADKYDVDLEIYESDNPVNTYGLARESMCVCSPYSSALLEIGFMGIPVFTQANGALIGHFAEQLIVRSSADLVDKIEMIKENKLSAKSLKHITKIKAVNALAAQLEADHNCVLYTGNYSNLY